MNAQVVGFERARDEYAEAWRALAARSADPNPFHDLDYVDAAVRHLGAPAPEVAVVDDGDRLLACLPVRRALRIRQLPCPALTSHRHVYWGLGAPLLDRDALERAAPLLADLLLEFAGTRLVFLEWLPAGPEGASTFVGELAADRPGLTELRSFERAVWPRDVPAGEASLSSKRMRELRRQRTALDGSVGTVRVVDRSGEDDAFETCLRMEAAGWKGARGTTVLRRPGHAEFFREVRRRFLEREAFQLLSLEAGDRPVAMKWSVFSGDGLFYLKAAFDESMRRYSPGLQLEIDAVRRFAEDPRASWIDACTDADNAMMNRLFPGRRRLSTYAIAPNVRGLDALGRGMMSAWRAVDRRRHPGGGRK